MYSYITALIFFFSRTVGLVFPVLADTFLFQVFICGLLFLFCILCASVVSPPMSLVMFWLGQPPEERSWVYSPLHYAAESGTQPGGDQESETVSLIPSSRACLPSCTAACSYWASEAFKAVTRHSGGTAATTTSAGRCWLNNTCWWVMELYLSGWDIVYL